MAQRQITGILKKADDTPWAGVGVSFSLKVGSYLPDDSGTILLNSVPRRCEEFSHFIGGTGTFLLHSAGSGAGASTAFTSSINSRVSDSGGLPGIVQLQTGSSSTGAAWLGTSLASLTQIQTL